MSERRAVVQSQVRKGMRGRGLLLIAAIACLIIAASSQSAAQKKYPTYSSDDFVSSMKTVGRAYGAVNGALAAKDFETAKQQLMRSREHLVITVTFWRDRKKDDALKILRETVNKMDDLDAALSAASIDATSVGALAKQVGSGCQACHAIYREQDPSTKAYRFKLDSAR